MRAFTVSLMSSCLLPLLAACTQTPVEVVNKAGQDAARPPSSYSNNYAPASGYSSNSSYSSNRYSAPVPQNTNSSVSVQNVGISDLPPPPPVQKKTSALSAPAKPTAENKETKPSHTAFLKPSSQKHLGFIQPAEGKIISRFGAKGPGIANNGINIASAEGEPVVASADGEVIYTGSGVKSYGNMVIIKHSGDRNTSYAHLSKITAKKYDHVQQGDIIGYVGSTGSVKEPQLHFALRKGRDAIDPESVLPHLQADAR